MRPVDPRTIIAVLAADIGKRSVRVENKLGSPLKQV
jgi:hypothetical protein